MLQTPDRGLEPGVELEVKRLGGQVMGRAGRIFATGNIDHDVQFAETGLDFFQQGPDLAFAGQVAFEKNSAGCFGQFRKIAGVRQRESGAGPGTFLARFENGCQPKNFFGHALKPGGRFCFVH
jgi:hypothetical protein